MTNYREILRLSSLGLNNTQIAQSCACSRTTVIQTLRLAQEKGITFPLPDEISDKQLAEILFPSVGEPRGYKMPDYEYVHKEMQKSGVTLNLLWMLLMTSVTPSIKQLSLMGSLPVEPTYFAPLLRVSSPRTFRAWR